MASDPVALLRSLLDGEHRALLWASLGCATLALWYLKPTSKKSIDPTDFDGFLKQRPNKASPTDFDSFLKGPSGSGPAQDDVSEVVEETAPLDAIRVPVLYGTEYGFSKEIAEKLCGQLKEKGSYWPVLLNMADFPQGLKLANEQILLVVCSTQGDGVPPPEARDFCDWLSAGSAGDLSDLNFSVCALGDSSYPHFCRSGKTVDESLDVSGGNRFVDCQEVDREDWKSIDRWMSAVIEGLPLLQLPTIGDLGDDFLDFTTEIDSTVKWGKSVPYCATITNIRGLCKVSSAKDKNTLLVEFDLGESGIQYIPGDALGIYALNCPKAVDGLLTEMKADGEHLIDTPSWYHDSKLTSLDGVNEMEKPAQISLRRALSEFYDIKTPKSEIFTLLLECQTSSLLKTNGTIQSNSFTKPNGVKTHLTSATFAQPTNQSDRLKLLINDDKLREEYLEERHLIDILQDFNQGKKLSIHQIIGCLRALQPRMYSISSSPLENPSSVSITVAEVMYTSLEIERKGVASTCLSQRLQVGDSLPIYVSKNPDFRLPMLSTPIIMVGPGTGLAPFRGFVWERVLTQKQFGGEIGKQVLFFGCRKRDQDYLYGDMLEQWSEKGVVTLFSAFSREQETKIYVQHKLKEVASLVWELLDQGAHFYVCGDANAMAGDVEKVLLEIIDSNKPADLGTDENYAKDFLEGLASTGRYQRDVWF
ncbi:hypothetical protein BSKO_04246 [Bryopsis sp. KO-2023]|nr:hypothetical protein BSKO_04246 [Bryopsis sp. KO-2023]